MFIFGNFSGIFRWFRTSLRQKLLDNCHTTRENVEVRKIWPWCTGFVTMELANSAIISDLFGWNGKGGIRLRVSILFGSFAVEWAVQIRISNGNFWFLSTNGKRSRIQEINIFTHIILFQNCQNHQHSLFRCSNTELLKFYIKPRGYARFPPSWGKPLTGA